MKYRKLGRTNFEISEMGYGAWGIGGTQWLGGSDDESLAALRRAIELGLNFIDTALAYGAGHSEQLVGQVVREAGREIYVATKVPPKNQLWPAQPGIGIEQVFPYDYILRSTERSLQNLGVETIDLLQLHVWNPEWTARDEWRRALEGVKRSRQALAAFVVRAAGAGAGRGGGARARRVEALRQGAGGGNFDQRPSAGFGARNRRDGLDRHGAGDLQHIRSKPGAQLISAGDGARYWRDRTRAAG